MIVQVVKDGVVANVIEVEATAAVDEHTGAKITLAGGGEIAAEAGVRFMSQDSAGIGWTLAGNSLVAPALPVQFPSADDLLAYAAGCRYAKEIGGISVGGIAVATDDRSKQMIMGARIAASADSAFTTPWVGADGTIANIGAAQIVALSDAVLAHVQRCFTIFATVAAGIAAPVPTVTTTAQIDVAFA